MYYIRIYSRFVAQQLFTKVEFGKQKVKGTRKNNAILESTQELGMTIPNNV